MTRVFDKNMLIMTSSVMVGFIVITYFVADIVHQSQIEQITTEHGFEIDTIEEKNINFTSSFLESSVLLDSAREDRAFGNYYFDLARLFYTSALAETNEIKFEEYQIQCIQNCSEAMPIYLSSHLNFQTAADFFYSTIQFTDYQNYIELLMLYTNLSESGAQLTILRYNASMYLKYLSENITYVNGTTVFISNMSIIEGLFNETMNMYGGMLQQFQEIQEEIDEYDIKGFSTIREPV
jgi:hypothetical protein